jgi:hypothetical protein
MHHASRPLTLLQVLMFLVGLVSIVLFVYGMGDTSKTVVRDAFTTIDALSTYLVVSRAWVCMAAMHAVTAPDLRVRNKNLAPARR